jgi:hypothetical protein
LTRLFFKKGIQEIFFERECKTGCHLTITTDHILNFGNRLFFGHDEHAMVMQNTCQVIHAPQISGSS